MSCICLFGVCIPYPAVLALLAVVLKPLTVPLIKMGILPLWLARRLGIHVDTNIPSHEKTQKSSCCEKNKVDNNVNHASNTTSSSFESDGKVRMIESIQQFHEVRSQYSIVVAKFTASWCRPCKVIQPFYESLATEFRMIPFCVIDVDELDDVARECAVSAMPTFIVFRNGEKVASTCGANQEKLRKMVSEFLP